jgi:hypothetical protein
MGTLHAAASVIQIHFRYIKHLRETEKRNKAIQKNNSTDAFIK